MVSNDCCTALIAMYRCNALCIAAQTMETNATRPLCNMAAFVPIFLSTTPFEMIPVLDNAPYMYAEISSLFHTVLKCHCCVSTNCYETSFNPEISVKSVLVILKSMHWYNTNVNDEILLNLYSNEQKSEHQKNKLMHF